jgi:hypothetical protein
MASRVLGIRPMRPYSQLLLISLLALAGCKTRLDEAVTSPPDSGSCSTGNLKCAARSAGACSRLQLVPAVCDASGARCPEGSREVNGFAPGDTCLPFHGPQSPITSLGSLGVSIDDGAGHCLWVLDDAQLPDGDSLSPAVIVDENQAEMACPGVPNFLDGSHAPVVVAEGVPPDIISLHDSVVFGGESLVLFRRYTLDATQGFGVRKLGSGIARWDPVQKKVIVPAPIWTDPIDFGDTALTDGDSLFVYGCGGMPLFLTFACQLARSMGNTTDPASYQFWNGTSFVADRQASAKIFESGPERSSVRFHPATNQFIHLFIVGFGTQLELQTARSPNGPWSAARVLADCDLPSDDPHVYCAGAAIHDELADPLHPEWLVVHYDIGTLSTDGPARRAAHPESYWTHLVRVAL